MMNNPKPKRGINLCDIKNYWERSGGNEMGGHFNNDLYLKFLESYNNLTYEQRSGKKK